MEIGQNKVVSITYTLREAGENKEIIQQVEADQPLVFLYGAGQLLPKFEEHLAGKSQGDAYEFTLLHMDAYGPLDAEAVVEVPIDIFMVNGKLAEDMLTVGGTVRLRDDENRLLQGTVLSRGLETVKIDFNHPMAGKDLHFSGIITGVRPASEEEITHGHVHGEGGHHH
jgi:FKBP-type peptidyl-prolyl cis-trans isomerase SlyD